MKLKSFIQLFIFIITISCVKNDFNSKNTEILKQHKENFLTSLTSHFPNKIGNNVIIAYNEDIKNNNIHLYLLENNVKIGVIDSLKKNFTKNRVKPKKVNRNEIYIINKNEKVIDGFSEFTNNIITINKESKYPIPNFLDLNNKILYDLSYDYYIIDYNNDIQKFKNLDLKKDTYMPLNKQNGMSKGIAISELHKTIIFWIALW